MKTFLFPLAALVFTSSCIPERVKDEMNDAMMKGQQMLADQEFKKAIGNIELHKMRNGEYPNELSDLDFLTAMDSSIFAFTEYRKLGSAYELNIKMAFPEITGGRGKKVRLQYPPEFWRGLGCIKSNAK